MAPLPGDDGFTRFGTLFTSVYRPADGTAWYRWPSFAWEQSFDRFVEGTHEEVLAEGSVA